MRARLTYSAKTLFTVALLLNAPWELLQMPLYADRAPFSLRTLLICVSMSIADAATIVGIAAVVNARLVRRLTSRTVNGSRYAAMMIIGGMVAIVVEYTARVLGLWRYNGSMPTAFGLGVAPILQLMVLFPAALWLAVILHRRRAAR